ncbi:phosphoribosylaminoimidazolesuccinocarboxamide synthase [Allorhodopirellula heiligendammensis]|uniref:Phosphoribosylaminoimidazole-succinocarboxamide synthase n=1 Tax=Allorhodopirellula heiligendammensis TaxID=2714739 RepID=A0A5C6C8H7_9BACT|nr:phosphoribosylaminoimidazolesuccinocarboxamide synthase [Allorhodopirellula heiligendammensis]TWU19634.1 Phosphoribosylaminoimidazole-succinocarboxamide synthase [Allorhodopirellula heiligendammensis]
MPSQEVYRFDSAGSLLQTSLPFPRRQGKVRDVYDLGDCLLIVSTDRISAFDYILPSGIPGKGELLTAMSRFWFDAIDTGEIGGRLADAGTPLQHHLIGTDVPKRVADRVDAAPLKDRIMVVRKAEVVPFECVVRGYLEGSGWLAYQNSGEICGVALPAGLRQCEKLASPIFTPATKAEEGHDENVPIDVMIEQLGADTAEQLRKMSLVIYEDAARIAARKGVLIADTKFEFGRCAGDLMLIDEVLTPDSSRFWAADEYEPGRAQRSFDKQFVREWLQASDWDRNSPPPPLPQDIVEKTANRYREGADRLRA